MYEIVFPRPIFDVKTQLIKIQLRLLNININYYFYKENQQNRTHFHRILINYDY